jgi:hypothetical protein
VVGAVVRAWIVVGSWSALAFGQVDDVSGLDGYHNPGTNHETGRRKVGANGGKKNHPISVLPIQSERSPSPILTSYLIQSLHTENPKSM